MKTTVTSLTKILMIALLFAGTSLSLRAEGNFSFKKDKTDQEIDTLTYYVYRGKVLDSQTNNPLVFASISVNGENTATISNGEGDFVLKIKKTSNAKEISVSYLGYKKTVFKVADLSKKRNVLKLDPAVIRLDEIKVYPGTPDFIIKRAMQKIAENYGDVNYNMTGFYRESIQKKSNYVSLSEAVLKIFKSSYMSNGSDQVLIYKGRKGTDVKKMDTLLVKLQGGPVTSLLLDIIKNPSILLSEEIINAYNYNIGNVIKINNRLNYVVNFKQKYELDFPLYSGKFYIDIESLAITGADFALDLDDPDKASSMFIKKKPLSVKVEPTSAIYSVNYREQDGKWFFNYARGEVKFKIKWKRKLFYTHYTTTTEVAITDRSTDNVEKFSLKERFKTKDILSEKVGIFEDKDYWGEYNYIEPDQSIQTAIKKLNKLDK